MKLPRKQPKQPKHRHDHVEDKVERGDIRGVVIVTYKCECGHSYKKTEVR